MAKSNLNYIYPDLTQPVVNQYTVTNIPYRKANTEAYYNSLDANQKEFFDNLYNGWRNLPEEQGSVASATTLTDIAGILLKIIETQRTYTLNSREESILKFRQEASQSDVTED